MRISDWSSDVCYSDLLPAPDHPGQHGRRRVAESGGIHRRPPRWFPTSFPAGIAPSRTGRPLSLPSSRSRQTSRRTRPPLLLETPFDRVPDQAGDIGAVEPLDLLDAGRRGHVDLGEPVAEHVDADEDESLIAQRRPDRTAEFQIGSASWRERGCKYGELSVG